TGQYQFKRTDQNETKIKYKKFKFIKNYFGFFAIQLPELEHNVESEALLVKCTLRIFFIPLYFKRVPIADLKNIKGPGVYVLPEKNLHYEPIFGYVPFSIQILDDGKYNDTVKYFKFRYPGYSHFEDFIFLKE
ncbi:MAG: hypothetical protein OEZ34_15660, partial [Spirochaetia bacterium]|nr:hypothetical protein [Spirochaetia bacterium]